MNAKDRLIVALDVDTLEEAEVLAAKLKDHAGVFKVGMQLYMSEGPRVLERLHQLGCKVFADLKFHDIPNTVKAAGRVMTRHGVFIFNVHAAGGFPMMEETVKASREEAEKTGRQPLVIAVTVLTSMGQETFNRDVGIPGPIDGTVQRWAKLAQSAGVDGVVASAREIPLIREACGPDFKIITPGIRPAWAAANDQTRIVTPADAIKLGADFIVVGRPITGAPDPVEAAQRIVAEMEGGRNL